MKISIYDANAYLRQSLNRGFDLDPQVLYNQVNATPHPVIFVWDGPFNNDRRRAIYPPYKQRDYTGQENIFAGLDVYRELLACSRAIQVTVPRWEADDVCYTLAKRYTQQGCLIDLYTVDFDFHQLSALPGVAVVGMRPIEGVLPQHVSLYKALRGDPSDKIPGLPGFGPKAWASFAGLYDLLDRALAARDVATLRAQPWKPSIKAWLTDDDNVELLFTFYQITQFLDVPLDEINAHTLVGQPDPAKAADLFKRFML